MFGLFKKKSAVPLPLVMYAYADAAEKALRGAMGKDPMKLAPVLMQHLSALGYIYGMADALHQAMAAKTPDLDEPSIHNQMTISVYNRLFGEELGREVMAKTLMSQHNAVYAMGQRIGGEEMFKTLLGKEVYSSLDDLLREGHV